MFTSGSHVGERIRTLSDEQLGEVIARCEDAISDGTAVVDDYEAFVLAQKELARRTWA
jgi:hypothetical protein